MCTGTRCHLKCPCKREEEGEFDYREKWSDHKSRRLGHKCWPSLHATNSSPSIFHERASLSSTGHIVLAFEALLSETLHLPLPNPALSQCPYCAEEHNPGASSHNTESTTEPHPQSQRSRFRLQASLILRDALFGTTECMWDALHQPRKLIQLRKSPHHKDLCSASYPTAREMSACQKHQSMKMIDSSVMVLP